MRMPQIACGLKSTLESLHIYATQSWFFASNFSSHFPIFSHAVHEAREEKLTSRVWAALSIPFAGAADLAIITCIFCVMSAISILNEVSGVNNVLGISS